MQFTAESNKLRKAVAAAASVILSKNSMPILDCVLIRHTTDGTWQLVAGSTELQVVIPAPLECTGKVTTQSFCVPAGLFSSSLRELTSQPLTLDFNEQTLNLHITHQSGSFDMMTQEADSYPIMEIDLTQEDILTTLTAEAEPFIAALHCGTGFCGLNEAQAVMTGVCIDIKKDSYTFAATNGKMLYRNQIDCGVPGPVSGMERTCIVQPHIIRALRNVAEDGAFTLRTNGQKIQFEGEGWSIIGTLVDGNYPNYNAVIPRECPVELSCNTKELIQAVKRVRILANRSSQCLRVELAPMMLRLAGQDLDYATSAEEEVVHQLRKGTADTLSGPVGLSAEILLMELNLIKSESVILQLTDPSRPCIIREDEQGSTSLMLAMPMKVD